MPANSAPHIVGEGTAIKEVCRLIEYVAATDAPVFILGESGVGKELVARRIHELSSRAQRPFIPVNMAALPAMLAESTLFGHERGAFTGATEMRAGVCEAAERGTLFLDEIGEMDVEIQSKLLRFLQDFTFNRVGSTKSRRADVRIVSATNRSTEELIESGRFRDDLFYRLNVVPIEVPPLRARQEDIPILIEHFLSRTLRRYHKPEFELTSAAMSALCSYHWPGNIRELKNVVERLVILARRPQLDLADLPLTVRSAEATEAVEAAAMCHFSAAPLRLVNHGPGIERRTEAPTTHPQAAESTEQTMEALEQNALRKALEQTSGRVVDAANLLGIGQATAYRKIKRYNIDPTTFRDTRAS